MLKEVRQGSLGLRTVRFARSHCFLSIGQVYALAALSDQADTATFHIVRYHQAWMEDDRLFIQTELCQGNLAKEVAQNRLTLPRRYKLLRELCLALAFLHRHHMVHLDIKPENIFIKNDQFKLGDFGLVSKSSSHDDVIEEGDSRYMSLELLTGEHTELTKSDIFSLGATLYEICRGHPLPLNGPEWQEMRHGHLQYIPQDGVTVDSEIVNFIHQMMRAQANERPSAADLLQHPKLLSDDQKALRVERHKVEQANLALQRLSPLPPPPTRPFGRSLQRSNTWSGASCHF
jgi:wee1-like protein kinase